MDGALKERFLKNWDKYFPGADLPIGFYYTDEAEVRFLPKVPKGHRCAIADLARARKGQTRCFDLHTIGCGGGMRYFGFESKLRPEFAHFLSYGIPGKVEGERYKKTPALVREAMKHQRPFKAPGKYIVFKRWDRMEDDDRPLAIIFFAPPDILSGLFTLANYDESQPYGVITPFSAGCASIVHYPYKELKNPEPRAVLGMFDVSARPCVPSSVLTFTAPWPKFVRMVDNMNESFLITKSWGKVRARMRKEAGEGN